MGPVSLQTSLRSLARRALFRAGVDVSRFPRTQTLPGLLRTILSSHDVDTVVDVGANTGQFGRLIRSIGYRGPIISFEPLAEPAAVLRREALRSGPWHVHELALGATAGNATINVSPETMLSSLLRPGENFAKLDLRDTSTVSRVITVETLDAMVDVDPMLRAARRVYLKTDTQGYDEQVLAGSERLLERVVALQVELAAQPIYEDVPDWRSFIERIEERRFVLAGLFPVNTDRHLRLVDMDGVFIRTDA